MKKLLLPAFVILMITACGTRDNKNEVENYPTYDTTEKMENINTAPADSSSLNSPKDHGDIH